MNCQSSRFPILSFLLAAILLTSSSFLSAQQNFKPFFEEADNFFAKYVTDGLIDYSTIKSDMEKPAAPINKLTTFIETANLEGADKATIEAFYVNAYNLLVIQKVVENYPLKSVLDRDDFFGMEDRKLAGEMVSLNVIEKEKLLAESMDPRFHFALVCGALSCPPITNFAYRPALLEQQLENQTRSSLNNPEFIRLNSQLNKVGISKIFEWYSTDFGDNDQAVIDFINSYREVAIPANYSAEFYTYDWDLNETDSDNANFGKTDSNEPDVKKTSGNPSNSKVDLKETKTSLSPPKREATKSEKTGKTRKRGQNNANRYVVSAAIPKDGLEAKWFNNLYTQRTGDGETLTDRATFFTSSLSVVYGLSNRVNVGFDLRYRAVSNDDASSSPADVFGFTSNSMDRNGFTNIGPKVRWAPTAALPNFSIQSALWIPLGSELEGTAERPYIDWDSPTWLTQLFNDFDIGRKFSLFTELDFLWEDIGGETDLNRFSTPVSVIFSYFPTSKATLYYLTGFSPYYQQEFDYFAQTGIGGKYQFSKHVEIELLYTRFTNKFLQEVNGDAATYNLGFRFSR